MLAKKYEDLTIYQLDVADHSSVEALAARVQQTSIDVLIHCAGVMGPQNQTFANIDYEGWKNTLEVNALSLLRLAQNFVDNLQKGDRRLLVTLTSGMGSIADNTSGGLYAYRSSKAAVNMVNKSLSVDLAAKKISCVVMNPGWVKTDMGGPSAPLEPEQSITNMRKVIAGLSLADTGKFYNHTGQEYSW